MAERRPRLRSLRGRTSPAFSVGNSTVFAGGGPWSGRFRGAVFVLLWSAEKRLPTQAENAPPATTHHHHHPQRPVYQNGPRNLSSRPEKNDKAVFFRNSREELRVKRQHDNGRANYRPPAFGLECWRLTLSNLSGVGLTKRGLVLVAGEVVGGGGGLIPGPVGRW